MTRSSARPMLAQTTKDLRINATQQQPRRLSQQHAERPRVVAEQTTPDSPQQQSVLSDRGHVMDQESAVENASTKHQSLAASDLVHETSEVNEPELSVLSVPTEVAGIRQSAATELVAHRKAPAGIDSPSPSKRSRSRTPRRRKTQETALPPLTELDLGNSRSLGLGLPSARARLEPDAPGPRGRG